jgi:hypothetical protein
MREELVEFLRPDKRRVAIAVLLPYLWVGVRLAISFLSSKIWGGRFIAPVLHLSPVSAAISILAGLLESLLYYPFACALVLALDYHRKGELGRLLGNRRLLGLEIAGLVLFNPPVMGALLLLAMIGIYALMAPQYGLEVIEVYPDSPTIGFGSLREGSTITKINDILIFNATQATEILDKSKPGEKIELHYDRRHITLYVLKEHKNLTRGYLGIRVRDAQGNEVIL